MTNIPQESTDPLKHTGEVKTTMDCHNCSNQFVALLDYGIDGTHVVECPHCGHEHYRVIKQGTITGDRWLVQPSDRNNGNSDKDRRGIKARRVWKSNVLAMRTSSASEFMRQRWLEKANLD